MKVFSASEAKTRILVWHAPVPVFHWLLALLGFWWLQWQNPSTLASGGRGLKSQDAKHRPHPQDDD